MNETLIPLLKCPECGGKLEAIGDSPAGALRCVEQGHTFPVERGIPRLVPSDLSDLQEQTAEAFGWQWQHFDEMHDEFERQFLDWIHPLEPSFFTDKTVLDAGCGMGRHLYFAARYGSKRVVGIDLSRAVDAAARLLEDDGNVDLVQGDLTRPPFRSDDGGAFDLVYSIGVLHHLPEPAAGFHALVPLVRPGGAIFIWVYGYEGNSFVRTIVEPIRRVSTQLPPTVLRALALPLAVVFHGLARFVYRPRVFRQLSARLPLAAYMTSVSDFTFRQNYGIVFDQLVAPKSHYLSEAELSGWAESAGLEDVWITPRNENSWRMFGRKPE